MSWDRSPHTATWGRACMPQPVQLWSPPGTTREVLGPRQESLALQQGKTHTPQQRARAAKIFKSFKNKTKKSKNLKRHSSKDTQMLNKYEGKDIQHHNHQRNEIKLQQDTTPHLSECCYQNNKRCIGQKRETLWTVGGNINWYSLYGKEKTFKSHQYKNLEDITLYEIK